MRGLMVTMVKSSDSELPVLDFPRASNLRRACAVRKVGIWERDCYLREITFLHYSLLDNNNHYHYHHHNHHRCYRLRHSRFFDYRCDQNTKEFIPPYAHAPMRLTIFGCMPTCTMISNSLRRSFMSLSVAVPEMISHIIHCIY